MTDISTETLTDLEKEASRLERVAGESRSQADAERDLADRHDAEAAASDRRALDYRTIIGRITGQPVHRDPVAAARRQALALRAIARLVDTHPALPAIEWTVDSYSPGPRGHVWAAGETTAAAQLQQWAAALSTGVVHDELKSASGRTYHHIEVTVLGIPVRIESSDAVAAPAAAALPAGGDPQ